MNCDACKTLISSESYMQCNRCKGNYHLQCLNISMDQFASLSKEYRASWICPSCNNVTRRTRSNINTPVRQHQVPSGSMNMSLDNLDRSMPSGLEESMLCPSGLVSESNEAVTMDKISQLLDQKLQSSLSIFMNDFRAAIREDVKTLVRNEIKCTIQELKNDFNCTINYISDEQTSLRAQIDLKNETIRNLEEDTVRLQSDITKLNGRLSSLEKISRSNNIELHAVPESRNENVVAIFRKLCETINVNIDDASLIACRRVAKMDATSKRPRNILISLSSPRLRDTILSQVTRYNKAHSKEPLSSIHLGIAGETRRVYVAEHLSPECKFLYAQARRVAKEKSYKYVWVRYGRIYVRQNDESGYVYIKDCSSLDKL